MPNFHNILVGIQTADAYKTCVTLSKLYLLYFVTCLQIVRLIVPIIFTSNANNLLRSPYLASKFETIDNSNFSNSGFYPSDKSVLRYLSLPCTQLITQANPKGTGHCAFSELSILNPRVNPFSLNAPCVALNPEADSFYPSMLPFFPDDIFERLNPSAEPFRPKTSPCEVENEEAIPLLQSTESLTSPCEVENEEAIPLLQSTESLTSPCEVENEEAIPLLQSTESLTSPCEVENEKAIPLLQSTESLRISKPSILYNINLAFPVLDSRFNVDAPIFRPNNYKPIPCRIDIFPKTVRNQKIPLIDHGNNDNDILNDSSDSSGIDILKDLRARNLGRIIIGHLHVNSIRNKLEMFSNLVKGNIEFLYQKLKSMTHFQPHNS